MPQIVRNPDVQKKPKLLDQVRFTLKTKHYSLRTEDSYIHWIVKFILFHNKRNPKEMGAAEVNAFLTHLAVKDHVAASTQNQALCAIVFLYKRVLKQELGNLGDMVWAKKPKKLPVVLTKDEVKAVLNHLCDVNWIMAMLLYGSGLRLLECLRLRVKDVDFGYNQIVVRETKGNVDRVTMLSQCVKKPLQQHLEKVKRIHEADLEKDTGPYIYPMLWIENILMQIEYGVGSTCSRHRNYQSIHNQILNEGITFTKQYYKELLKKLFTKLELSNMQAVIHSGIHLQPIS